MGFPKLAGFCSQLRRCSVKRYAPHDSASLACTVAYKHGSGIPAPLRSSFGRNLHTSRQSFADQYKRYGPAAEASMRRKRKEKLAREEEARNAERNQQNADKPQHDTPTSSGSSGSASEPEPAAREEGQQQDSGFQLVGEDASLARQANGAGLADKDGVISPRAHADALNGVFLSSRYAPQNQQDTPDSLAILQHRNNGDHANMVSSPYVHHFDTHTLVLNLQKGGFTEDQAIDIMQGIRGILADNLRLSDKELVSKSDLENESYLFKAACSELRFAIAASRALEVQSQRTRRTQLQHELDILTQRMGQDFLALRDDLKEMFNNQKISTRELQRSIDTSIQELNYQITVSLNSDGKSTVEGLRWILTRRAAIAIATSAFMIILALRFHSYQANAHKEPQITRPPPSPGHNNFGEPVSVHESEPMG